MVIPVIICVQESLPGRIFIKAKPKYELKVNKLSIIYDSIPIESQRRHGKTTRTHR